MATKHKTRHFSGTSVCYRQSSPDTSYFSLHTPDAEHRFAYSTTLRRHHSDGGSSIATVEANSLWTRALLVLTGTPNRHTDVLPATRQREEKKDTLSAQFAHCSVEDTVAYYRTNLASGLLHSDMPHLREQHGYNEFSVAVPEPLLLKFLKTIYESPLILLLCGSAAISAIMGNVDDAVSITVAVLIVLTVGFVQERRSEKSLEALNKLVPHHCHVVRENQTTHVLANELVPGDLVKFSTGDRIPADIRITDAVDLEIDESSLTGETNARSKTNEKCAYVSGSGGQPGGEPAALADRSCIAYMGTLVRNGRGSGVVIATGEDTEFGVIFSVMQQVEEKRTPLQLSMDELAKKLSILSFGVIGVICLIGVLQQRSWLDMFTIGVSLAVAAIPEGLPIVTTVTLALGVLRMAKRKAIVKKLHSVEALGSVSVICSDKTGTLTKNEQTVTEAYAVDETIHFDPSSSTPYAGTISPAMRKALEIGSFCNNASLLRNEDGVFVGQSTDVALLNVLSVAGISDRRNGFKRLSEKPFNSEQKYMAVSGIHVDTHAPPSLSPPSSTATVNGTVVDSAAREMYYVKGSIDLILDRCKFYYVNEDSTPGLDAHTRKVILTKAQSTASRGLRVIAMAYGYGSVDLTSDINTLTGGHVNGNISLGVQSRVVSRAVSPAPNLLSSVIGEKERDNLVFVGFAAMFDPPRKGVADSVGLLQAGGVHVVMITGDAEQTAVSIAKSLGLHVGRAQSNGFEAVRYTGVLTGPTIDTLTPSQLSELCSSTSVFARATPKHKMRIVEAFQKKGFVVGMTGDGVNDAPALKMADIGLSMGKSGTDVAKEAADCILVDDAFETILFAIEEGKSIFHNIQNFLSFQLSTAAAALTLITLSTMLGLENPLNAMQILFINILMDGPPSQSLGVDPVDPAVMRRPPRKKNAPIITRRLLYRVLFSASVIVLGTLFVYRFALDDDGMSRREQTMTFTCFVFLDLVSAVQNRGLGCEISQNKMLITTVSISFVTQLALVYVPFLQAIFQTAALDFRDLGVILVLAGSSFSVHEVRRWWERGRETRYTNIAVEELV
ncbi:High affinity Ca2+/Mn2+ P-type ATPase-like protein [Leucoagaricus gongylophorus]